MQTAQGHFQLACVGKHKFQKRKKTAAAILAMPAVVPPKGWILPNSYGVEALLGAAFWQIFLKQLQLVPQGVCLNPESGLSQNQLLSLSRSVRALYWLGALPQTLPGLLLQHSGTALIACKAVPERVYVLNLNKEVEFLKKRLFSTEESPELKSTGQFLGELHPLFRHLEPLPLASAVWEQWQCKQALAELCKDIMPLVQQRLKESFHNNAVF